MSELRRAFFGSISNLYPGYFAIVMATGVIAIQSFKFGYALPSYCLVAIATISYIVLWILTLIRAIKYFPRLASDFRSFRLGPGFFTMSAGTTVLGKSFLLVLGNVQIAIGLWIFAWFIWSFLLYSFCLNVFTSPDKLPLQQGINGVWLIMPVATQSLSILTCLLSPIVGNHSLMILASLSLFMLGCALYVIVIAAVVYRLAFFPLEAKDMRPAYWVCMGGSAISTFAGVELCKRVTLWPLPFQPLSAIQGFTMFFWVLASAWFPMLVGLGLWRHLVKKYPMIYDPQYWSLVFPLAIYAVCTYGIAEVFGLASLNPVAKFALILASIAWIIVFANVIRKLLAALHAILLRKNHHHHQ